MFLQSHVLLILTILVLAMNALGLGFTLHKNLRGDHKAVGSKEYAGKSEHARQKELAASH